MQLNFAGKRALVTGAAQGIGRAIALGLQQAGASLTLVDIDEAGLTASAKDLDADCFGVDLGDRAAVHAMVGDLAGQGKAPDILVHAAGGTRGQAGRPLEEIDEDDLEAAAAVDMNRAR